MFLILGKYQWISVRNRSTNLKNRILSLSHWFLSQPIPFGRAGVGRCVPCPVLRWSVWGHCAGVMVGVKFWTPIASGCQFKPQDLPVQSHQVVISPPAAVVQLLGGFRAWWVGMNTPDLAWKGEHGLRALCMDWGRCSLQHLHLRAIFKASARLWCCCWLGWKKHTVLVGANICTCCSENAENGSSARNVMVFISSPLVRDFTSQNPLCYAWFFWSVLKPICFLMHAWYGFCF